MKQKSPLVGVMPTQKESGCVKLRYPENTPPATPIGMTRSSATIGQDFLGQNYIILLWDFSRIVADSCSVISRDTRLFRQVQGRFIFLLVYYRFPQRLKDWSQKMDNYLRKEAKLLKALQGVSYKELAEHLEIKTDSFYCWMKGYYNFSPERQARLLEIITLLKE